MVCPRCESSCLRTSRRRDALDPVLSVFGWSPVRCQTCAYRFYRRNPPVVPAESERREFERLATLFPVTFEAAGTAGKGEVVDISAGGCGIRTSTTMVANSPISLVIEAGARIGPIVLTGRVVRGTQGQRLIGVKFDERLRLRERQQLAQLVELCRQLAAGPTRSEFSARRLKRYLRDEVRWWGKLVLLTALAGALSIGMSRCTEEVYLRLPGDVLERSLPR